MHLQGQPRRARHIYAFYLMLCKFRNATIASQRPLANAVCQSSSNKLTPSAAVIRAMVYSSRLRHTSSADAWWPEAVERGSSPPP